MEPVNESLPPGTRVRPTEDRFTLLARRRCLRRGVAYPLLRPLDGGVNLLVASDIPGEDVVVPRSLVELLPADIEACGACNGHGRLCECGNRWVEMQGYSKIACKHKYKEARCSACGGFGAVPSASVERYGGRTPTPTWRSQWRPYGVFLR